MTAWQPAGAAPVLWVSRDSLFDAAKPIRGGVPVCFPWFAAHGTDASAPMHGFARLRTWTLTSAEDRDGEVHLTFELVDDELSRRSAWPHRFRARYRVVVGDRLGLGLDVYNTGEAAFTFEAALHTYFAVKDIRQVSVTGLAGTDYLDKVDGFARKREGEAPIRFVGETDRIYLDTEATCTIDDPGLHRRIEVAKTGLALDDRLESLGRPGPGDRLISATTSGRRCCASRRPMSVTPPLRSSRARTTRMTAVVEVRPTTD